MILGVHPVDFAIVMTYFAVILYVGVFHGGRRTKTLGDFFVAGGKWGALISFIFVFASAVAGNEAVVVGGQAYKGGLSGVWLWWNFLFATPIYYLFATYFRRARVYNLAEFFEMRYGRGASALYSAVAGVICILFIGMFLLAISKILVGLTTLSLPQCIVVITLIVGAYVFAGGMMSTLLTDVLQGLMCLFILSFIMLPFLWIHAGGWPALQALPKETWNLTSPNLTLWKVLSLNTSALVGGIAAPWIYNWIAVSRSERAATQCGWGHLWKRIITLLFALYGILFAIYKPGLADPELAWGAVMKEILPWGVLGLLIASFFAAVMSSAATYATTSSAMVIDYFYRKVLNPGRPLPHYLLSARFWAFFSVVIAAATTQGVGSIKRYVDITMALLSFLGIPIYFGVWWKRSNRAGMWASLVLGIASYLTIMVFLPDTFPLFCFTEARNILGVFIPTALALLGMIVGCLVGSPEDPLKIKRFHVILNTPIGREARLVEAGIVLPQLVDMKLVENKPERLNPEVLGRLYDEDCRDKFFGPDSTIELRREPTLPWYFLGFFRITAMCVALVAGTWLLTRLLFVWQ
ncbi:sodium:solute symporter family protein [bacterium]|nr:sodium:solute symporter family protein [bacterium]